MRTVSRTYSLDGLEVCMQVRVSVLRSALISRLCVLACIVPLDAAVHAICHDRCCRPLVSPAMSWATHILRTRIAVVSPDVHASVQICVAIRCAQPHVCARVHRAT